MTIDVRVLGAGIAGSTVARTARRAGLTVEVVDPAPHRAASHAAVALLRMGWHNPGDDAAAAAAGLAWHTENGWVTAAGALTSTYRKPGAAPTADPDWWAVDPDGPLVAPDTAEPTAATAGWTVDCRGAAANPAGKWGWTAVAAGHLNPGIRVHTWAPYRQITAAQVGATIRCGSSTANQPEPARQQLWRMMEAAEHGGLVPAGLRWKAVGGLRPYPPAGQHYGTITWTRHDRCALNGLGKFGYALAPARAATIVAAMLNIA